MPHMSNELKNLLASSVYEQNRSMLTVAVPAMKPWDQLTGDEQAQCREAMRFWLDGLGSSEVGEAWFDRSGHVPRAIWDQVPHGPDRTIFIMAALDLLGWLIAQAELGLKQEQRGVVSMAEREWTQEELQGLAALGLSITPHADANLGWGYTWLNRDWVGPLPTPGAAIHAAFTNALLAMQFERDYSWVLFAQPGELWRFDGDSEGWVHVSEPQGDSGGPEG